MGVVGDVVDGVGAKVVVAGGLVVVVVGCGCMEGVVGVTVFVEVGFGEW